MANVELTLEVEGDKEVSLMFQASSRRARNLTKPFKQIRDTLLKTFDNNFSSRGRTLGEPWKPRTKSYPWPILERTGKMRKSFRGDISSDYVVLYNTQDYFKYHQSKSTRKKLPRRVMMKIDEQRRRDIIKEIQAYIMGAK